MVNTQCGLPTFGTCGIRGVVGETITDEVIERVAGSVARYLGAFKRVCVARDTRPSSPDVEGKLIGHLAAMGVDVLRLGVLPTPGLYLLSRELGSDLGIMVTASHNTCEYNGFKICDGDGMSPDQQKLEQGYYDPPRRQGLFPGKVEEIHGSEVLRSWLRTLCPPPLRPQKLVVDCACGPASALLPEILAGQGHEIVMRNCTLDLECCDRDPEPMPSTLEKTVIAVRDADADGGICLDGDGDRVVFLDRNGCLGLQRSNAIMARVALEQAGGGEVVGSVETGRYVEEAVKRAGGSLHRTVVGDINIAREVRQRRAVIGVEECGHYVMPRVGHFSSTIYASTFLLAHRDLNTVREELASMPRFFANEIRVKCHEQDKPVAMEFVRSRIRTEGGRQTLIDGVRLDWEDGWILVRPSGTSPYMKVNAEATSHRRLQELMSMGLSLVEDALG